MSITTNRGKLRQNEKFRIILMNKKKYPKIWKIYRIFFKFRSNLKN